MSAKKAKTAPRQRKQYTAEHRSEARRYYLIGLNLHEISKLLDGIPIRTLENWQMMDKWTLLKGIENIKIQVVKLREGGKSMNEIAEMLKIHRVTAWRYLKEASEAE
ncbi:MAG: hypothetical protein PHD06_11730 [Bacteroidales bacterium]|jgi:hypothetical protein|nr:hypothetical protein [Bacteroidales bacterium]